MSSNFRKCTFICAPIKDSNQPAHLCNLISHQCLYEEIASLDIENVPSEDSDQTA